MKKIGRKEAIKIAFTVGLYAAFFVTRLFQLTELPEGFHLDEAGAAYDGWCLARYGVDRYLNSWPVYLINYGGGQSVLYAWLCALLFGLFGYHAVFVRLPAVIFSLLTLVFGMKLARRVYPDSEWLPFVVGAMIVFCPCFILSGRMGLDCYLMLGASMVFLTAFLKALEAGKCRDYVIAGVSAGVVLYTYVLSYFILPLFLLLTLLYCIRTRRFVLKHWASMGAVVFVLAIPLILVQIVNCFDLESFQIGIFTITRLGFYRASELKGFTLDGFVEALSNLFVGDLLPYNSIPGYPNLFYIAWILLPVGLAGCVFRLVRSIRRRQFDPTAFLVFWFAAMLALLSCMDSNVNRIIGIFGVAVLIEGEAVRLFWRIRNRKIVFGATMATTLLCAVWFLQFGHYYYGVMYRFDYNPMDWFEITVPEAIDFLEEHPQWQGKGTWTDSSKIHYALSMQASPYDMQFSIGETRGQVGVYHLGGLGPIEEGYNYIVWDVYGEYAQELRTAGYLEESYDNYSLFYKEWSIVE